jgi:hypothetical protein
VESIRSPAATRIRRSRPSGEHDVQENHVKTVVWIVWVVIWIAIAFWPARVAGRKGHSFIGFFIFSLIFFPAALIVAYVVRDRAVARS